MLRRDIPLSHAKSSIPTLLHEEEKVESAVCDLSSSNTIVVVDDQPMNIEVLQNLLLKKLDRNCVTAYSGREALKRATELVEERKAGRILFLMDVNMPLMDGSKATSLIREILHRDQQRNI